jgi:hypothetical protein
VRRWLFSLANSGNTRPPGYFGCPKCGIGWLRRTHRLTARFRRSKFSGTCKAYRRTLHEFWWLNAMLPIRYLSYLAPGFFCTIAKPCKKLQSLLLHTSAT